MNTHKPTKQLNHAYINGLSDILGCNENSPVVHGTYEFTFVT